MAVGLPAINSLLNTFIIGPVLGEAALAVLGFATPLTQIITTISVLISIGAQLNCGRHLGEGDKEGIRRIFNTSLAACVLLGLPAALAFLLLSDKLAVLLGAEGPCLQMTADYIRGLGVGVVFSVLSSTLLPFLQLDRAGRHATICVVIMTVSNVTLNLLNVYCFKMGMLGVGLASSLSSILVVLTAVPHFAFKSKTFRFSLRNIDPKCAGAILYQGLPTGVSPIANAFRGRILNQALMTLGGTTAVSALTVADTLNYAVCSVIEGGYSGTGRMLASVLAGERDRDGLRDLPRIMVKAAGYFYIIGYLMIFIFAKPIALLMGAEPESIQLYVMATRLFNLWYLTNPIKTPPLCILQGTGKIGLLSLMTLLNNLIFPAAVILLPPQLPGLPIVFSVTVISEVLCILTFMFIYKLQTHHWPPSLLELVHIPETLSAPQENILSLNVRSIEETIAASEETKRFCREKGLPNSTAYYCALCVEEMAVNVIRHGFPAGKRKDCSVDIRVIYEDDSVSMVLRDDCPHFDPNEWLELCASDDPFRGIGIRMVSRLSKEMRYANTLGLNVLTIRI